MVQKISEESWIGIYFSFEHPDKDYLDSIGKDFTLIINEKIPKVNWEYSLIKHHPIGDITDRGTLGLSIYPVTEKNKRKYFTPKEFVNMKELFVSTECHLSQISNTKMPVFLETVSIQYDSPIFEIAGNYLHLNYSGDKRLRLFLDDPELDLNAFGQQFDDFIKYQIRGFEHGLLKNIKLNNEKNECGLTKDDREQYRKIIQRMKKYEDEINSERK